MSVSVMDLCFCSLYIHADTEYRNHMLLVTKLKFTDIRMIILYLVIIFLKEDPR